MQFMLGMNMVHTDDSLTLFSAAILVFKHWCQVHTVVPHKALAGQGVPYFFYRTLMFYRQNFSDAKACGLFSLAGRAPAQ